MRCKMQRLKLIIILFFRAKLFESGMDCGKEIMKMKSKPSAIFAANDEMASGVMKVIIDSGYEVPKNFSIAGFDDTPVSQMLNPPLSTIRQPLEKMGELAAKKLIAQLEGFDFFENQKPESKLYSSMQAFSVLFFYIEI